MRINRPSVFVFLLVLSLLIAGCSPKKPNADLALVLNTNLPNEGFNLYMYLLANPTFKECLPLNRVFVVPDTKPYTDLDLFDSKSIFASDSVDLENVSVIMRIDVHFEYEKGPDYYNSPGSVPDTPKAAGSTGLSAVGSVELTAPKLKLEPVRIDNIRTQPSFPSAVQAPQAGASVFGGGGADKFIEQAHYEKDLKRFLQAAGACN